MEKRSTAQSVWNAALVVMALTCLVAPAVLAGGGLPAERPIPAEVMAENPCALPPGSPTVYKVDVPYYSPVRGNKTSALITIVEISEFQCPFCARIEPTMKKLLAKYPNELRVVFRHNPLAFHKNAHNAAMASMAAGLQGRFWEMHDLLFENSRQLDEDNIFGYASRLGLDMVRFKNDYRSTEVEKWIQNDQDEANRLGARGVPATFINGQLMSGAQPYAKFEAKIEELLPQARRAGGSGDDLYRRLTSCGLTYKAKPKRPARLAEKPTLPAERPPAKIENVPVEDSYWIGDPRAKVTIVVFSDFQCPYCNKINKTFAKVLDSYGGKVRIVFKHNPLPFHKQAQLAAEAAMAAGAQGKFWQMHDLLFENARQLSREKIEQLASQLGLDLYRFKSDLDQGAHRAAVERDKALAKELGAKGTPTAFVNGRRMVGAQPFARFKEAIDQILSQ